jgi:hypothetical protein
MVGWVQKDLGSVACSLDAGLHVGKGDRDFMQTNGRNLPNAQTPASCVDNRQKAAGSWRQRLLSSSFPAGPLIGSAQTALAGLRASGRW